MPPNHEREQTRVRADPLRSRKARSTRGQEGLGVGHPEGPTNASPGQRRSGGGRHDKAPLRPRNWEPGH
eukprot:886347-Alexandrium_andersonii.AAC.1